MIQGVQILIHAANEDDAAPQNGHSLDLVARGAVPFALALGIHGVDALILRTKDDEIGEGADGATHWPPRLEAPAWLATDQRKGIDHAVVRADDHQIVQ